MTKPFGFNDDDADGDTMTTMMTMAIMMIMNVVMIMATLPVIVT